MMPKLLTPLSIVALFGLAPLDFLRTEPTLRSRQGLERYAAGDYAQSAADLEAAAKAAPDSPELAFDEAAARYKAGDYAGAIDATTRALKNIDPRSQSSLAERAHYNAGNAWFKQGQYQQAIDAYDNALSIDPSDEDARHNKELAQEALRHQHQQPQQPQQQQEPRDEQQQGQGQGPDREGSSSEDNAQQNAQPQQKGSSGSGAGNAEQQPKGSSGGEGPDDQPQDHSGSGDSQRPEGQSAAPQRGGPSQPFANPALPPPPAGKEYPPLSEGDVDRLLKRLQDIEGRNLQRLGPNGGARRRMRSPLDMDPFSIDPRDFFNDPFFADPFRQFGDDEGTKDGNRKDW